MPDTMQHHERSLTNLDELHPDEFDRFIPEYRSAGRPVLLRQYHAGDEALRSWSIASLRDRLPDQSVDLDVGDAMVTDGLVFEVQSLHEYLRALETNEASAGDDVRYLQGFNIFAHDPSLYDEIVFPHLAQNALRQVRAGWIGPAGTVTGYHADVANNQLSQVVGRKMVKLVSPDQSKRVYRTKKYDPNGIACAVNADKWNRDAHPLFAETEALLAVLEPGDSVFIPGGWYHYVRSLTTSVSVNHMAYSATQATFGKAADQMRRALHNVGLYGPTCTCHMIVDGERVKRR